jgi:predicted aconitase
MKLAFEEQQMLDGEHGHATQKAMEILVALGIYLAQSDGLVTSVQIPRRQLTLGEADCTGCREWRMQARRVLTTLNPAGMDIRTGALGISEDFARNQLRVIDAFARMNVVTTCSCTPYLIGNAPHYGQHIAWSESSAVCYANSVIGARSNREGGPSALAAALTGVTPEYGMHLDAQRRPGVTIHIAAQLPDSNNFGALGVVIGKRLEQFKEKPIAYIIGVDQASVENLKSFCASVATYGGAALFHMRGVTPEADRYAPPDERITITQADLDAAKAALTSAESEEADFVSLGCPHLTLNEIARIAELLKGHKVTKEFWITTARPTKQMADMMGYTRIIEEAGAKLQRIHAASSRRSRVVSALIDSAKACYYAAGKNNFKTIILPFDEVVLAAVE